jgi:hypothetical protein
MEGEKALEEGVREALTCVVVRSTPLHAQQPATRTDARKFKHSSNMPSQPLEHANTGYRRPGICRIGNWGRVGGAADLIQHSTTSAGPCCEDMCVGYSNLTQPSLHTTPAAIWTVSRPGIDTVDRPTQELVLNWTAGRKLNCALIL